MNRQIEKLSLVEVTMKRIMTVALAGLFCFFSSYTAYGWQTDNGDISLTALSNDVNIWLSNGNTSPELVNNNDYHVTTHPYLTYKIIKLFEQQTGIDLPSLAEEDIVFGSIEEDYDAVNTSSVDCYNHIESDDYLLPLSESFSGISANRSFNHFLGAGNTPLSGWPTDMADEVLCDSSGPENLVNWANYDDRNLMNTDYLQEVCQDASKPCDTLAFWKAVGHVLHLLEDASSPAHVRNDPHVPLVDADFFEDIMGKKTPYDHNWWIGSNTWYGFTPAGNSESEKIAAHITVLADHTRENYFSRSTIWSQEYPVVNPYECGSYVCNQFGKKIAYKGALYWCAVAVVVPADIFFDTSIFNLDDNVLSTLALNWDEVAGESFSDLGAQAIGHGAAVLTILYDRYIIGQPGIGQLAPVLRSPADGVSIPVGQEVTFSWKSVSGSAGMLGEQYCLEVIEEAIPNDIPAWQGCSQNLFVNATSTQANFAAGAGGKTYWWAVWAKDNKGNWSKGSEWWSFTTECVDAPLWYQDADGDGYGTPSFAITSCTQPSGYVANNTDCDDTNPNVHPSTPELCNGVDDNCDGIIDNNAVDAPLWYRDADGDGYGNPNVFIAACAQPAGYVVNNTDCDDTNPNVHPGAPELCNGVDDNCDGLIDNNAVDATLWYRDADGDGYGSPSLAITGCTQSVGYVANKTDCDDTNSNVHPGVAEVCGDSIDQDCDGSDLACPSGETILFSDDFNRADGNTIGNGWTSWWNNIFDDPYTSLVGGEVWTYGWWNTAGGIFRTLPVEFPIKFSFDFRTLQQIDDCGPGIDNNSGWSIAFNMPYSGLPPSGNNNERGNAQIVLNHYC